ncbi:MAG: tRNA pseudouridine(55) synthase TruB, partial [Microcystaceae cyanobacterium]
RLYELARKGEKVDVPVRTVEVYQIDILAWYPGEFAQLEVAIACGPGTYIRAIARDLGERLNVGGTLAALTRTESCGMKLPESLTFEQMETQLAQGTFSLISLAIALQHLPTIDLNPTEAKRWCQGQSVQWVEEQRSKGGDKGDKGDKGEFTHYQIHNLEEGQFLGIGEWADSIGDGLLVPKIVLC